MEFVNEAVPFAGEGGGFVHELKRRRHAVGGMQE
jgi:hypothetical protein